MVYDLGRAFNPVNLSRIYCVHIYPLCYRYGFFYYYYYFKCDDVTGITYIRVNYAKLSVRKD